MAFYIVLACLWVVVFPTSLSTANQVLQATAPKYASFTSLSRLTGLDSLSLQNASTQPLPITSLPSFQQFDLSSTSKRKVSAAKGFSVSVGHVDAPSSPLRPKHCRNGDAACVSQHRLARHQAAFPSAGEFGRKEEDTVHGPVVSGVDHSRAVGDYYVQFAIGEVPSRLSQIFLLDTASDLLWVQAFPCKRCFDQRTPHYFPILSASVENVGCFDWPCENLRAGSPESFVGCGLQSCSYKKLYTRGSGAFSSGDLAKETFTFSTSDGGILTLLGVVFGKATETLFPSPPVGNSGILGLGGGNGKSQLSFATQIAPNFGNQFSFCLPTAASDSIDSLAFGPDAMPNPNLADHEIYYTPLKSGGNPNFYYVGLKNIIVGTEEVLGIPEGAFDIKGKDEGGVIVDTAAPYTVLPSAAYDPFLEAFISVAEKLGLGPVMRTGLPQYYGLFDTCWDITGKEPSPLIPKVTFQFEDGGSIVFARDTLVVEVKDEKATHLCLAILRSGEKVSAIGNYQLQNWRLVFDLPVNRLGWLPNACL